MFDTLQFRVLRERLFQTLTASRAGGRLRLRRRRDLLGPDEVPRLAGGARPLRPPGRGGLRGTWGRGTGVVLGVGLAVEGGAPDDAA